MVGAQASTHLPTCTGHTRKTTAAPGKTFWLLQNPPPHPQLNQGAASTQIAKQSPSAPLSPDQGPGPPDPPPAAGVNSANPTPQDMEQTPSFRPPGFAAFA